LLALGTFVLWAWGGFHVGWSQNKVPVEVVDEITGIENVIYEERFVAGVDTIVIGFGSALAFLLLAVIYQVYSRRRAKKFPG
jgi:hypothetical protein